LNSSRDCSIGENWKGGIADVPPRSVTTIELALPKPGVPYRKKFATRKVLGEAVHSAAAIFEAMLADHEAGPLGNFANQIRAEVCDEFVAQSET
jgi:hypothetical protein